MSPGIRLKSPSATQSVEILPSALRCKIRSLTTRLSQQHTQRIRVLRLLTGQGVKALLSTTSTIVLVLQETATATAFEYKHIQMTLVVVTPPTRPILVLELALLMVLLLLQSNVGGALTPQWGRGRPQPTSATQFWTNDNDDHDNNDPFPSNLLDSLDVDGSHHRPALTLAIRGGGANKVLQGSKSSIALTLDYWSKAFQSIGSSLTKPFRSLSLARPTFLQSKATRRQNELLQQLQTTPIERVAIVPNSTVVPPEVLQIAAKRAGMLGRPLQSQSVQDVARSLKQWYDRKGYVLHSMTGATLQVDTRTAELSVQEPVSASQPVAIVYCKEMVIDPDDGSLMTFRQYRDKVSPKDSPGISGKRTKKFDRSTLNTTFVPTDVGRTNPNRIAAALGMNAGEPFCWHPARWKAILQSGLFKNTLRANPQRLPDGTVQLQLIVQEAPARNLEYGLSKSLYTDSWEGEIDFQHRNVLGGGESLGVLVRRGTQDAEPSVRIRFRDDKFGIVPGGYDVEVFSDYIGEHLDSDGTREGNDGDAVVPPSSSSSSNDAYDHDELLDRKGISMSIRSPFFTLPVANSGSATLERTSTKGGRHESVGSATLNLGPVARDLPLDARTNVFGKVTTGSRVGESTSSSSSSNWSLLPFASFTCTTRQTFPLTMTSAGPLILALQHSGTASSRHLPRHEANANGVACKIRGYQGGSNSERVASSLVGTTELRIPVQLPRLDDASVVLFGDWCLSSAGVNQKFKRRSSVGVSLRKRFQGLPIKYDISYTQDRKIGAFFGLGSDFQA